LLYSQPHRHYHNLHHIAECLAEFDSARDLIHQPMAVELAIWFHDAVYDTRAQNNEERSGELAKRWIANAGGTAELCEAVASLIMATKTHEPTVHPDAPLLVDVDLSVLGQPQERFQQYETQIRREYDWVPVETFAAKRAEVLERFLGRKRLYTTDHFFAKYEQQARANLQNSIRTLNKS
jgi:predicted metal-dependent HD superfamily phosphohydrolase